MSWPRYCSSNDAQPVPKAAYRSGCHDEHNRVQCGWNLGRLIPQSVMLTTRPVRCAQVQSHSWLACSQLVVYSHICFCSNVAVPMRMYRYCRTDFVKWQLSTFHSALSPVLCSVLGMPSVLWCCGLGGWKGIRPVKTDWWGAGVVVCLEQGAHLHMAQLMPLPLTGSCFSKIQIGLPFWYWLTWVVPEKGPLNRCVCVSCVGRGWVGLGGLLHTTVMCPYEDGHHLSTNWA